MSLVRGISVFKLQYFIWSGSHFSLSWFQRGSSLLVELEFGDVGFCGGRKTRAPREKTSEQGENQQQIQPTYCNGPELNPSHNGGRRALSLSPQVFKAVKRYSCYENKDFLSYLGSGTRSPSSEIMCWICAGE